MTDHLSRRTESLRDEVRKQTDAAHAQLHLHASFVGLFNGTLSLDRYQNLIERFYGFYMPLDHAIEQAIAEIGDTATPYAYVRRSDILARDVCDLLGAQISLPQCTAASSIVTPTTLGGVLYVIEGATLGATQIDRAAQKLLSDDKTDGRRFWAWCRAQNKGRWSMANAYMQRLHDQGAPRTDIIKGAQDTFQTLADWLAPLDLPEPALMEDPL